MFKTIKTISVFLCNGKEVKLPKDSFFEIIGKPENTEYLIKTMTGKHQTGLLPISEMKSVILL